MIRISSNYSVQRYQKDLNELDYTKAKLMEQGDGKKLHRPSDNSVDYSRYLRYNVSEGENDRYQESVKAGISWMNTTQTALSSMEDIQKTFKAKTIQGANDDKDEHSGDWPAIAREMKAQIQQIVSLGNTQLGDRYVFSGQADLRQPFSLSDEKKPLSRGLAKTLDDRQAAFFNDASNGNSADFLHQMLSLDGSDGKTYYLNTLTGDIYTKQFVQEGYKDVITQGRSTVSAADRVGNIATGTNFIKNNFKNTGSCRCPRPWCKLVRCDGSCRRDAEVLDGTPADRFLQRRFPLHLDGQAERLDRADGRYRQQDGAGCLWPRPL